MKNNKYKVIGKGGHSKVIIDCINRIGGNLQWNNVCYGVIPNITNAIIGIGDNYTRKYILGKCRKATWRTLIHPSAIIAEGVEIGEGTVILAGAIVNTGCKIGKHCIVNTGAILEHDSVMEDFSSLAPRVATGGNVYIGECSAIGLGAVINNDIKIGSQTVIGSGSVVTKDIKNNVVAYGVPCKIIRERKEGEKYL